MKQALSLNSEEGGGAGHETRTRDNLLGKYECVFEYRPIGKHIT
jgi:hypothetical protein